MSVVTQTGKQTFRPRARLIRLLGAELISDEVMAITELVKNAYDADADTVTVRLNNLTSPKASTIEVVDDGVGMSLDTLLTSWLEPATSFKRPNGRKRRTARGRYPLGEKGVGRFAADKLGAHLELVSRAEAASEEVRVEVAWDAFGDGDYLDEVETAWEVRSPVEFLDSRHGTILRIRALRREWDEGLLDRLHQGLARLISPTAKADAFAMYLECSEFPEFSGLVQDRLLATAPYVLVGMVDSSGRMAAQCLGSQLNIDLRTLTGDYFRTSRGRRSPSCGPFSFSFSVWDLDGGIVGGVSRSVRALLKRSSGVSIYRDGFHVAPYGDRGDDWLGLNQHRVNNPTMRVSTNQLIGAIEISQEGNPALRDRTSREGLLDSPALEDLKVLAVAALSQLEEMRFARRKSHQVEQLPAGSDPILEHLNRARAKDGGSAALQSAMIAYRSYRKEVEDKEAILLRLASAGAAIATILGPLNHSISTLQSALPLVRAQLPVQAKSAEQDLRLISDQLETLEMLFENKQPDASDVDLRAVVQDALTIFAPAIKAASIDASVNGSYGTVVKARRNNLLQALLHVVENSLIVAVSTHKKRAVEIVIDSDWAAIEVRDSGPGIPKERRELIFEPFFSSRPGGNGLGLYLARNLMRADGHELVVTEDGSSFRFVFTHPLAAK